MTVKGRTATVKYSKLKKAKQTVKISKLVTIKNAQGKKTYKLAKVNKSAKYFSMNASTGKLTIKKKLKKGTYKLTIKVTAAGNSSYKAVTKKVTAKVVVK